MSSLWARALRRLRIRKCRLDFNRLSPRWQCIFAGLELDPDSKVKRGDFDRK